MDRFKRWRHWTMNKSPIPIRLIAICALSALALTGLWLIALGVFNFEQLTIDMRIEAVIGGVILFLLPLSIVRHQQALWQRQGGYKFIFATLFIILGGGGLMMSACGLGFTLLMILVDLKPYTPLVALIALPSLVVGSVGVWIIYRIINKKHPSNSSSL